ncbi:MAG: LpxI family protein, partial [Planctomycetota bacterium]
SLLATIVQNLPDLATLHLFLTKVRKDRRSDTVLLGVADVLAKRGITLIDSTTYSKDHMATPGVMGNVQPTDVQRADAQHGWDICGYLSKSDVGQAIAVKDKDVIAIEAVEGTQRMIQRAGELCRGKGWTLVKRGNTRGDLRVDVPTIAEASIEQLHAAGARALCLEAGKVIMLEKDKVLAAADQRGIAVFGMEDVGAAE